MKIKQLMKAHLQGCVCIEEYNDSTDCTVTLWQSNPTSTDVIFPKEFWNREIEYMYPAGTDEFATLIIELKPQDTTDE